MDLIKSIRLDTVLAQRNAIVGRIRDAHRLLMEAIQLQKEILEPDRGYRIISLQDVRNRTKVFTDPEDLSYFIKQHDAAVWATLMEKSGLRSFMDATARAKWDDDIANCDVPELTAETITATFAKMYEERQTMFERGVVKVFENLSWDYKTNNPVKFGKRIVDRRVVWSIGRELAGINPDGASRIDDLIRVMLILDGKPEPDHRDGALHTLQKAGCPVKVQEADLHGLLRLRFFKNGNAHVTFLRPDLVDQLNRIVARHHPHALPPASE